MQRRFRNFGAMSLGTLACACATPPPPPDVPEITLDAAGAEVARQRAAALERVRGQPSNASRRFYLGWEMHSGYWLHPADAPDELVRPDFDNERVLAQFDAVFDQDALAAIIGKRLVCVCRGVSWSIHGQPQFLVREADISVEDP